MIVQYMPGTFSGLSPSAIVEFPGHVLCGDSNHG